MEISSTKAGTEKEDEAGPEVDAQQEKGGQIDIAKVVTNRPNQDGTTRGKLKYVPGPVGAFIDQAADVGLHLVVNSKNELEFQREGRGPIPLIGWNRKAWKQEVKRHINDDLLRELHDAVTPAHDNEGNELPPGRKDMVGFPANVDRQATMAIIKNRIRKSQKPEHKKENVLDEVDLESSNPKHMATLQSIMAGSIRPNTRLTKPHGLTPKCRCGADKEDSQHVFIECKDHSQIRD